MANAKPGAHRYCGRTFNSDEIEWIRRLISSNRKLNRSQLSRAVCNHVGWVSPNGRLKEMSCRVAMLRMHRDGTIALPPPRKGNGNGRTRPALTHASAPQLPLSTPAAQLGELEYRVVNSRRDSLLWNELIERYHYLGYKPLPGAQMRFLVFGDSRLLAALGFGASAWKVAARDHWIGWAAEHRMANLHLIVNNARFLILPWVQSRNLASRILGRIARLLPQLWDERYGYAPVMLETFVEKDRFRGTCYRAANWILVGPTQGRGKLDRKHQHALPVKDVFVYPLRKDFRRRLSAEPDVGPKVR
jgi:hypothetical protein